MTYNVTSNSEYTNTATAAVWLANDETVNVELSQGTHGAGAQFANVGVDTYSISEGFGGGRPEINFEDNYLFSIRENQPNLQPISGNVMTEIKKSYIQ